jgi:hypothetical protein
VLSWVGFLLTADLKVPVIAIVDKWLSSHTARTAITKCKVYDSSVGQKSQNTEALKSRKGKVVANFSYFLPDWVVGIRGIMYKKFDSQARSIAMRLSPNGQDQINHQIGICNLHLKFETLSPAAVVCCKEK